MLWHKAIASVFLGSGLAIAVLKSSFKLVSSRKGSHGSMFRPRSLCRERSRSNCSFCLVFLPALVWLDVDCKDDEVQRIYFPKGGWIDLTTSEMIHQTMESTTGVRVEKIVKDLSKPDAARKIVMFADIAPVSTS